MKTCKQEHEYDGEANDRCPECKRIAGRIAYREQADEISRKGKEQRARLKKLERLVPKLVAANKSLMERIAKLEAELQKEKVR